MGRCSGLKSLTSQTLRFNKVSIQSDYKTLLFDFRVVNPLQTGGPVGMSNMSDYPPYHTPYYP